MSNNDLSFQLQKNPEHFHMNAGPISSEWYPVSYEESILA